jgi:hypothetical protein
LPTPTPTPPAPDDHGNTFDTATILDRLAGGYTNEVEDAYIDYPGDVDVFNLRTRKGLFYTPKVKEHRTCSLTIFDADKEMVGGDDSVTFESSPNWCRFEFEAMYDGTYYLVVSASSAAPYATGTYGLHFVIKCTGALCIY